MSAGYVGSISLTQGLIMTFGYQTAFLACALGTVVGAIFGTVAAGRVANQIAAPPAERSMPHCSRIAALCS
jgi:hypothetical protein